MTKRWGWWVLSLLVLALAGGGLLWFLRPPPPSPTHVRVAAIQFHSVMGEVERSRAGLATLVCRAAAGGAKIIVLLGPDGTTRIHYRKQHLWTVADPSWVEPGDRGTPVIDTENDIVYADLPLRRPDP